MKIKNNKKSYKTSLLTSMIKQSKKFNEKIQIKRTPAKAKSTEIERTALSILGK
jgi:hypothetical protein